MTPSAEFQNLKQRSLYAKLKKLFSTDVIVRNIGGKKLKVVDTDEAMYATDRNTLRDRFNRIRTSSYNQYSRDFSLSYQASRIELFRDYDCVGADTVIPLPDGTYPTIAELAEKYKDMPQERFYVFSYDHETDSIKLGKAYHPRKKEGTRVGYKVIFDNGEFVIGSEGHPFLMRNGDYKTIKELTIGESVMPFYQKDFYNNGYRSLYNFSRGWQSEHKIIVEQFDRTLNKNEVVHHKNFDKTNNLPSNLQIMIDSEHREFHARINNDIIWSAENKEKTISDLTKSIGCDYSTIKNRLTHKNLEWNDFKLEIENTLNHKIVSIECIGEIDVYDVTVEKYQNFATDSCFVHNTMDMDPILSSAIDIYAEECITKNEMGSIITVHSENDNIKQILENLFYDILNVEFNLYSWTRNLVKYGDFYLKLHISPEYGIYMVEPLSAYSVTRVENSDLNNKSYTKFQVNLPEGGKIENLENYQVAHFRLLSDSNFLPYGKSVIENARRVWKQLSLMEDAMLIHRVMRAPEKRIFKIDVGNLPATEIDSFMDKMMAKMQKIPYIDEKTGDYNLRFNLQNQCEDFWLPVRGGDSGTSIEPLSGMEFTGIDDIEYLRNKLMAALKIPKAFLTYDESLSGKSTLSQEDVRFAKSVMRIQRILVSELTKIATVHLYAQGYTDASLVNFTLELTNPSIVFETEKINAWSEKVGVAKDMIENKLFPKAWIYENIFHMSNDDVTKATGNIVEDTKQAYRYKQIEEEGIDPAKPYNKIKVGGDSGGSGAEEMGGGEDSSGGKEAGGVPGGAPTEPLSEKSKKPYVRPSQAGKKKAIDYPFGEDTLGKSAFSIRNDTDPLRHKFKGGSALNLEGLGAMITTLKQDKQALLTESVNEDGDSPQKSFLDESNILDNNKENE